MRALALLMLVAACNGIAIPDQPHDGAHPISEAGTGRFYSIGETVPLDGSQSFDPDGTIVKYQWAVKQHPNGSAAIPLDPSGVTTSFTPDVIGTYTLTLTVTDDAGNTDASDVRVVSTGAILSVDAGADSAATWLGTASLTGAVTTMPGYAATYSWYFVSRPAGSATTIVNPTGLAPTFVPDATGTFVVALRARVGDETREDTVAVEVTAVGIAIGSNIPAYAFTTRNDHILYAHDVGYAEVVALDPATGTKTTVNAGPFVPTVIKVDHDQQVAAVAGLDTIVTVSTANLVAILGRNSGGCTTGDISVANSTRVDCFPVDGTSEPIRTVYMTNGAITTTTCPVQSPRVALSSDGGYMFMVDGASADVYVFDAFSTPVLPVVKHLSIPGAKPPVIAMGTNMPFALLGNGLAVDLGLNIKFDLGIPISAAAPNGPSGEFAVVSGSLLKLFGFDLSHPPLKFTAVLPSVNGEASVVRLIAYSANGKRLIVVAGTSAGDVAYTVAR